MVFFANLKFMAALIQVSLLVPFSNSICSLCVSVSYFDNFHNISNFFIIITFYHGDLWSVIFDVSIVIVLGHHKPYPYNKVNIINVGVF